MNSEGPQGGELRQPTMEEYNELHRRFAECRASPHVFKFREDAHTAASKLGVLTNIIYIVKMGGQLEVSDIEMYRRSETELKSLIAKMEMEIGLAKAKEGGY